MLVPVIILVILGSAGGLQKTVPGSNPPVTYMTTYVPVLIGLVLVMIALISLPIVLVNQREHAFLRRLSTTPVAPRWLLAAQVVVNFVLAVVAMILIVAGAALFYHVPAPAQLGGFVLSALLATAGLFPWLQKKGIVTFGPRSCTLIVPGTREELLQRSCDALDAARHFSIVEVSDRDFEVKARYRVPPVWADLTVSLFSHGTGSIAIRATISVLPNLFTVVTVPERRIFARFTGAMRKEGALPSKRPAPTPVATDQTPTK